MKLFISPHPSEYAEDGQGSGGIWRVINAQARWLPEYGVEIVDDEPSADIVCIHAGALVETAKPMVQTCHGFYWTGDMDWPREYWQYNIAVIEASREAYKIIVPSDWVAQSIRRDLKKSPVVIPHGIDLEEFKPQKHDNYVLWAKPRVDVVSDPGPVNELAALAPDIQFKTTFGRAAQNVEVLGVYPYDEFRHVLAHAAVWLATTRETGDIASREAMALGIPVLGWCWGATGELVQHKVNGYLAMPGDYDDLLTGLHYCLDNREELGMNAREYVQCYQWRDIMARYATVFQSAIDEDQYPVEVSVIVPAYNYARFLPECLESLLEKQTDAPPMEIIVVDDASTDNTQEVLSHFDGIHIIKHDSNGGLVASLNTGHRAARGRYITNLDADNVMATDAIEALYDAMEVKPWVDVGTGLYSIYGQDTVNGGKVDPAAQLDHRNQMPSTCMMRSRSIKRIGGYRARQRKNEDGEFWCRAISAGIRCEYVVEDPVFAYRWHGQNKTILEGGEDEPGEPQSWNFYYPWRLLPDIMPFACTVPAPQGSWRVRSYESPHISVVIPVGPGHGGQFLADALDSVYAQTFREFECVVANDTGEPLDVATLGHPWVRVIDTPGNVGPAIARNTAIDAARAPLIVPLDADDMMYPDTLNMFYEAWLTYPDSIVYSDCYTEDEPGKPIYYPSGKWTLDKIQQEAIYQDVILFAKEWWRVVGGYEPDVEWEDWVFGLKMHLIGIGATYIQKPWGVYRHWTSLSTGTSKSDKDNADYGKPEFKERLRSIYDAVGVWEKNMACVGCKGKAKTRPFKPFGYDAPKLPNGKQMQVICNTNQQGYRSLNSRATTGKKYRYKGGTILTLDLGDEWVERHAHFDRYVADVSQVAVELPRNPPKVDKLALPVVARVPVVARREMPEPEPQLAQSPSVHDIGLPEALADKLNAAGFKTKTDLHKDIRATAGAGIKAIKGVGKVALVKIREAVLG